MLISCECQKVQFQWILMSSVQGKMFSVSQSRGFGEQRAVHKYEWDVCVVLKMMYNYWYLHRVQYHTGMT